MATPVAAARLPSLAGWQVLTKSLDAAKARHSRAPEVSRELEYFSKHISKVQTPADLVKDRRLLAVVLDAYGLSGDINSQARVRKVLEGGVLDPRSLANRLVDPRYKEIAKDFSFDLAGAARLQDAAFLTSIKDRYITARFEGAVADDNSLLRDAMIFKRRIGSVANWYDVLADRGLFSVVRSALSLPTEFSKVDVDRQKEFLETKIGLATFKDPAKVETFIRRYLAVASASQDQGRSTPALQILNGMRTGGTTFSSQTFSALLAAQASR